MISTSNKNMKKLEIVDDFHSKKSCRVTRFQLEFLAPNGLYIEYKFDIFVDDGKEFEDSAYRLSR